MEAGNVGNVGNVRDITLIEWSRDCEFGCCIDETGVMLFVDGKHITDHFEYANAEVLKLLLKELGVNAQISCKVSADDEFPTVTK